MPRSMLVYVPPSFLCSEGELIGREANDVAISLVHLEHVLV
jgi:hypothetical protein